MPNFLAFFCKRKVLISKLICFQKKMNLEQFFKNIIILAINQQAAIRSPTDSAGDQLPKRRPKFASDSEKRKMRSPIWLQNK